MTEQSMLEYYELGKAVYKGDLKLKDAVEQMVGKGEKSSSAEHYILWYGKMRKEEISTWNTNSELLMVFAKRILEEEGRDAGETAARSVKKYANYASKKNKQKKLRKEIDQYMDENGFDYSDINGVIDQKIKLSKQFIKDKIKALR